MKSQVITRAIAAKMPPAEAHTTTPDAYQDRLLKLIPAEVVSVYLGVFHLLTDHKNWTCWMLFVVLLICNALYKWHAGVTDWKQYLITSIAFCLWVLSIGGPVKDLKVGGETTVFLSSIMMPIYTLVLPLIYK